MTSVGFSVDLTSRSLSRVDPSGLSSIVAILVISSTQPTSGLLHSLRFICVCWPHKRQCLQRLYIFSSTRKDSSLPGYPLHSVTNPTSVGDTASLPPCWGIYHNIHNKAAYMHGTLSAADDPAHSLVRHPNVISHRGLVSHPPFLDHKHGGHCGPNSMRNLIWGHLIGYRTRGLLNG